MDRVLYEENLRGEIMKFAEGLHRYPAAAVDQELVWDGSIQDYTEFLNAVQHRFLNHLDGAGVVGNSTHTRLTDCVGVHLAGQLPRSNLHAKICVLFLGHPDLFNRFEKLRLMNDGREETRHQIREWRNYVRQELVYGISMVLADCCSVIGLLRQMPGNLIRPDLEFIEKTCFSEGFDPNIKSWVMQNLVTDARAREYVLPSLEETQMRFWQMQRFVSQYFTILSSMAI